MSHVNTPNWLEPNWLDVSCEHIDYWDQVCMLYLRNVFVYGWLWPIVLKCMPVWYWKTELNLRYKLYISYILKLWWWLGYRNYKFMVENTFVFYSDLYIKYMVQNPLSGIFEFVWVHCFYKSLDALVCENLITQTPFYAEL